MARKHYGRKVKESYYNLWHYDYKALKIEMIFYGAIIIIILLILTYFLGVWRLDIVAPTDNWLDGVLYTILNALVFGAYMNTLGLFNDGVQNKTMYYLLIIFVVFFFLSGLGFWNFVFYINLPFLFYKYFSLSTHHGIYFIWYNLTLFLIIYVMSFMFERESKK